MAKKLTRRQFLSLAGASATGAVLFTACSPPAGAYIVQSPALIPEDLVKGRVNWYATTCGDCPGGDGLIVRVMEGRAKKIAGNPDFPINYGKQNVWADSELQMFYHPDRLAQPLIRDVKGALPRPISWDQANSTLTQWTAESGGRVRVVTNPVRGYNGWVAGQFAQAFGGKHLAFDPLEQGVLHGAIKTVFGQDRLPEFDIANAQRVLSFGADFLGTWVSPTRYAHKFGDFRHGRNVRGSLTHVEPRLSITGASADKWVPIRPGMEGELAMAIANVLVNEKLAPQAGIAAFTANLPAGTLNTFAPSAVEGRTGVSAAQIKAIAEDIGKNGPSLVIAGGSAGAHTNGTFNLTAAYSLNILLDNVGKKGGVFFNPDSAIKGLPSSATGLPFSNWQEELANWRAGNVNLVILRRADLAYGLPRSVDVPGALANVPHVVAFADVLDDTAANADLILPESSYLASWGMDIPEPGPGFQVVGFQQPVANAARNSTGKVLSDSRSFGDTLITASNGRINAQSMQDLVSKAATDLYNQGSSSGSIKAPSATLFLQGALQRGGWWDMKATASSNAPKLPSPVANYATPEFSDVPQGGGEVFYLMPYSSQALRDGRVAPAPWAQATPDPITTAAWTTWVEINDQAAKRLGIKEGDRLVIQSNAGQIEGLAYPHPGIPPDVVGVPLGQGHKNGGRYAEGRGSNVLSILSDHKDRITGALAWAGTKVRVSRQGQNQKVPKLEGSEMPQPDSAPNGTGNIVEPGIPILVVKPGESAKDREKAIEEKIPRNLYGQPQS